MNEPKQIVFDEVGRKKLLEGVGIISRAVRSTLGAGGNTVLIESINHTHGITVTKDGVTVARSINLLDPIENLAVMMMRQAADKTSTEAGDGTTTAIVLADALVSAGMKYITKDHNRTEVLRSMVKIKDKILDRLVSNAVEVDDDKLQDVAIISANNDPVIGKVIADAYKKVGSDGIVTIEKSQSSETYYEVVDGLKIGRGYASSFYINDHKRDMCVFDDCHILVCDAEISNLLQLESIFARIIRESKKLLIIAPLTENMTRALSSNVSKGVVKVCNIMPPSFGYKQHELMSDLAVSVGATYFSEKTGDDLSLVKFEDLGFAKKVIVGRDSTVIIRDEEKNRIDVDERVASLRESVAIADKEDTKKFLLERIAILVGGVGVIYVGGKTDLEQKELYDRVDDSVNAVRSALEEGIHSGGGKALYEMVGFEPEDVNESPEYYIAREILLEAATKPMDYILENAGYDNSDFGWSDGEGLNVKTGEIGNMIEMGIIDPVKVTRCALENAVSVAVTILSTNAIITIERA